MSRGIAALKFAAGRYVRSRADLSPLTRLLLEELIDRHNGKQGGAWPSQEFLAGRLGCGLTQIKGAIRMARRVGLLRIGKSARPTPCGYSHNIYMLDIELLAGLDPDRSGGLVVADSEVAVSVASPPAPAAAAGKPTRDGRETDQATVGKPTPNDLPNILENGARERAQETRRSAPPSPAVMAGYADRREEKQRQPRRDASTGGAAISVGDLLGTIVHPELRAVLGTFRTTMVGPDHTDAEAITVLASVAMPIIVVTSSAASAPSSL